MNQLDLHRQRMSELCQVIDDFQNSRFVDSSSESKIRSLSDVIFYTSGTMMTAIAIYKRSVNTISYPEVHKKMINLIGQYIINLNNVVGFGLNMESGRHCCCTDTLRAIHEFFEDLSHRAMITVPLAYKHIDEPWALSAKICA